MTDHSASDKRPPQRTTAVADAVSRLKRRDFIKGAASLGASAALPLGLAACFGGGDDSPSVPAGKEARTLFFNLSHENHAGKTYYLTGGGQRIPLVSVKDTPEVLRRVRATHKFLAAVPDDQITHHVENAVFANESVTLCYVSTDIDTAAGTWSMTAVQLVIPASGSTRAYASARARSPSGALPMSAKRALYGLPAAQTEQDLREERDLLDTASHAATLVGAHPDLMCLEPGAAHTVHAAHVDTDFNVILLAQRLRQQQYGPALPQLQAGKDNTGGWATLLPVPGDNGVPLKNQNGQHKGRIQYQPHLSLC